MSKEAQLEKVSLYQLAGAPYHLFSVPPYRHPHHSASAVSIIGGGTNPKPGEVSLTRRGILFLDELGEFARKTLATTQEFFHLLIKEGNESISVTMKRIGVRFVGYYNWKYQTTSHLFQDGFKSKNVETVPYLLTVVRYTHQNPIKAGIVRCVDEYKWSSCRGYYNKHVYPEKLLDAVFILRTFSTDITVAREQFKLFNKRTNNDLCWEDSVVRRKLTDEEARQKDRPHASEF